MAANYDTVIKGATVVNHDGEGVRDLGITDGLITAVGTLRASGEVIDCRGLHVLPGVIDTQVHFREPGLTEKEDLASGSLAAVLGGVTAVFEMPNTVPPTTSAAALADKVARAWHRMHCDFGFFIGGTAENVDELGKLERLPAVAGVKVFIGSSTGSLLVADDDTLQGILKVVSRRAAFHCEDEARLRQRKHLRIAGDVRSHPAWRDEITALQATQRLLRIARETSSRVHVLHVSTAQEMALLEAHKDIATVEVTPHHLTLEAPDCYDRLGTFAQMNPPLRDATHRDAIWRALSQGLVDILGSDHAPHTREEKAKPYPQSPSGMTGVQTLVPLMLDHVNAGRLTLQRLVDLTSHGPARVFAIARKGRIAVGYDADLTIVDLKRREIINDAGMASRAQWTPYQGMRVTGWPVGTYVRGRRVVWDGALLTPGVGEPVRFLETLV
jgi:dihydroorotase